MSAGGNLLAAKQAGGIGRVEGANSSSHVLALGCTLEIALSLWQEVGESEHRVRQRQQEKLLAGCLYPDCQKFGVP